jgi:hypothetical protein
VLGLYPPFIAEQVEERDAVIDVMGKLLEPVPSRRASAELLQHPFFEKCRGRESSGHASRIAGRLVKPGTDTGSQRR